MNRAETLQPGEIIETTSNTPSKAPEGLGSYAVNRTLAVSSVGSSDLNRCLLRQQGTHRFLKKDKSVEILTNNSFKTQVHVPSLPFTICHLEPVNFMTLSLSFLICTLVMIKTQGLMRIR